MRAHASVQLAARHKSVCLLLLATQINIVIMWSRQCIKYKIKFTGNTFKLFFICGKHKVMCPKCKSISFFTKHGC